MSDGSEKALSDRDVVLLSPAESSTVGPPEEEATEPPTADAPMKLLRAKSLEQDIQHRKVYAARIFWFVALWVLSLMLLLLAQGLDLLVLSDKVLMTLIGGTTANVLGLFAIVANYLFPKK